MKNPIYIILIFLLIPSFSIAQKVPEIYTQIHFDAQKGYFYKTDSISYFEIEPKENISLEDALGHPGGTSRGFDFDFRSEKINGTLYYGFIDFEHSKFSQPVIFKRPVPIRQGKASINILQMKGRYDMIDWVKSKKGRLGYRVELDNGVILYDGTLAFIYDSVFSLLPTIIEGPLLQMMTDSSVVVLFKTNLETQCAIHVEGKIYEDSKTTTHHEVAINDLKAASQYKYTVSCGGFDYHFNFTTAPNAGSRKPFTFAYASDSRSGFGGGERNIWGTNGYIIKKTVALAVQQNAVFMQFTGDLITGYSDNVENMRLEYANFKKVVSPFAPYLPIYAGIGNHEVVERRFPIENTRGVRVDRFPFETESMEALFAAEFANHQNGPISEDGMPYDPNPEQIDFPSYQENVFYYTYDNVAMIVLSSEYLYTPSLTSAPLTSGGLHGYIMDGQMLWLQTTLEMLEKDENIDHIFITQHTPAFPNGGHVGDAMWYGGDNSFRSIISGTGMKRGIIEQRDVYLDLIINKSSKVKAILSGDEHNYCKTFISDEMPRYPDNWELKKVKLSRSIYQINNGACGAPYYAQEATPWSSYVSGFSTQNALVLLDVDGEEIKVRVLNPDTLEEIESYPLNSEKRNN